MKIIFIKSKKNATYVGKTFVKDKNEKKKFRIFETVRDHCHYTGKFRGAAHRICNLEYKVPQEIPVIIHNGLKYDYRFIIREIGQFECLGANTEEYINFLVPIKKEHNNCKTIICKIKFVDTCRFMQSKLSDLADNLSEINNKDCKKCMERKNIRLECEFIGLKNNID